MILYKYKHSDIDKHIDLLLDYKFTQIVSQCWKNDTSVRGTDRHRRGFADSSLPLTQRYKGYKGLFPIIHIWSLIANFFKLPNQTIRNY